MMHYSLLTSGFCQGKYRCHCACQSRWLPARSPRLLTLAGGSCGCRRGGGWPEWGPTGPCAGCTGPCGNTSWLSTANLCCSDDANTGISDGTALVIVNIWNLIWTWYSLKEHCLKFGPWSPHLGIWVPMVTYFFTFPIFSISGFRMRWKLIEQPLSNVDHLISCENKDYLLGSSCNTRHYTTVHI